MTHKEIKAKYTRVTKVSGKWSAFLQIDQQGFCICEGTTKKRANWYSERLSIALQRILTLDL